MAALILCRRRRLLGASCAFVGLLMLVLPARQVLANGGLLQMADSPAGPYRLTIFTSPTPIQVGSNDVSVSVTGGRLDSQGTYPIIQDAVVTLRWTPVGHGGTASTGDATHDKATNKLFYATTMSPDTPGAWRVYVTVQGRAGTGSTTFDVTASAPPASPLLINIVLVTLLFGIPIVAFLIYNRASRTHSPQDGALEEGEEDVDPDSLMAEGEGS